MDTTRKPQCMSNELLIEVRESCLILLADLDNALKSNAVQSKDWLAVQARVKLVRSTKNTEAHLRKWIAQNEIDNLPAPTEALPSH